jgi:PAS domain S-box-containing protein
MLGHLIARKEDELARLESERRLSQLFQLSNDAILLLDKKGRFVQANRAAWELAGYDEKQLLSMSIDDFRSPGNRPSARKLYEDFINGRSSRGDFEFIHKDGHRIVVEYSAQGISDNLHMVVLRDVTERRIAEEELDRHRHHLEELVQERTAQLEETREKTRQTERLASIGTLAAGIAHEINNPVGMILLSAQLGQEARERGEKDDVIRHSFDRIVHNARRCGRIVKSVLQFARQEQTDRWPNCLNTVVQRAVKVSSEYLHKKNARLHCCYDSAVPPALLNPLEIEQVMINLIHNAVEACGEQAQVDIYTEVEDSIVRVVVADNGCGINEEHRARMFDPFYTTRRHEGGTGLGLSIAHGIITEHGGNIVVDSRPGQGTRIAVELPIAPATAKEDSHVQGTHCG